MSFRHELTAARQRYGIATAALLLLASRIACTEAKPTNYPMHTPFGFGNTQVTVDSTEASSDMSRKAILVHITMNNLDGESQARVASQSWDQWFRLRDQNGKKYKCRRFLPTDYYYQNFHYEGRGGERAWGGSRSPEDAFSPVPTDWIARFDVPLDAEGFALLLDNMTFHQGGQPVAIAVPLDR